MAGSHPDASGPDLAQGVAIADLPDGGRLLGHRDGEPVLLVRCGEEIFAVAAACSHYGGPLAEGLIVDDTVRCPWHHACFDLRTGEALRAPALMPLGCWSVEQRGDRIIVGEKRKKLSPAPRAGDSRTPNSIVIVGGGAAGFAAAERLRREQYQGPIIMLSDDESLPVDRPNLSKDYLAGTAPEDWLPLRKEGFYAKNGIDLRLGAKVAELDVRASDVVLTDGTRMAFDKLLLATGAEPVRLTIPGSDQPYVHTLRSLADSRSIIAQAGTARRAVVLGASFIGLEVAAALRTRGVEVHVVAPDKRPMERVLGPQMGDFIRALHEEHGVVFHLEDTATSIGAKNVHLRSGRTIAAEMVVTGIGVRPRLGLAEAAGLAMDRGVLVDTCLETTVPGIFAAGDIARWPDPHTAENIRVEHWVVAQRQGATAALNMLGHRIPFTDVPFFWSQHYDVPINYVGHAEGWDAIEVEGDIAARDCLVRFKRRGRTLAVATIFRDGESLAAELAMERDV
ncbi:FAD-dependent oxidoreductase [Aminobacter aminovorans]|jgi:NADPH-dependent 2,4-dienoyl-CoA reductase/sulfur reductase-like enzyme/nitrite reductase/ring-hydroxylating ferredoxin subunit|uniref:NADPH-dependent 2,4-dienoyl-CoA reductase/sulfur reductase-like enzyme/nitrite reductase/ring-hydroxylating ferredoxin subunit n=1 Tax=Aminobacter aminovorans TaxID=83263 RepID=A0AAC9FER0_AMIAI|nr:FAD-dependent oxidoreductase [Aminobacter aminovorans]AMS45165.1 Pyridine nucleotide-disulfide oxidoreductase family protein [Aminobacter aminovorans]MBB3705078.1 NADPH-dependent 2,4-dienoyl-CoA reductase/sulfur reductase-like enzyme/nitrite reductase/ring-hydroxylating ferredoxin subunit [Aminobacter aminovorans]